MKNQALASVFIVIALLSIQCKKDENGCANPKVSAGNDTTLFDTNQIVLKGVSSENKGTWSIVKGNGGVINNSNSSFVTFTGKIDSTYLLKWESTNSCGTSTDSIKISFKQNKCSLPTVFAGNDTVVIDENLIQLKGTSTENNGTWSIIKGSGGVIDNSNPSSVTFTGETDSSYSLKWESTNSCGVSSDTIIIRFKQKAFTMNEMSDNIHWIQQSCFRIEGSKYRIYTDPQSVASGSPAADIILVTHSHGDHFSTSVIKNVCTAKTIYIAPKDCNYTGTKDTMITLLPGEEYVTESGIKIKAVPAYNSNHPLANKWVGYLITMNGITIYHAGDTKRIEEMKTFTCDIALMPLGPTYTMSNVQEAVDATIDVQAKLAIPMHYGSAEGTLENAQTYKTVLEGKTPSIPVVVKTKGQ